MVILDSDFSYRVVITFKSLTLQVDVDKMRE